MGRRVVPPLPPPRRSNRNEGGDRLAREGKGQVFEDWAEPDAQGLADAGWLEHRTVDATGVTCWFWTLQAETVLDMNALRRDDQADMN